MKTIDDAKKAALEDFGRLSPFRVGMKVGEMDIDAENPYQLGSRGAIDFADGVTYGRKIRSRHAQPSNQSNESE